MQDPPSGNNPGKRKGTFEESMRRNSMGSRNETGQVCSVLSQGRGTDRENTRNKIPAFRTGLTYPKRFEHVFPFLTCKDNL